MIEGLVLVGATGFGFFLGSVIGAWLTYKGRSYKSPIPFSKDAGVKVVSSQKELEKLFNVPEGEF